MSGLKKRTSLASRLMRRLFWIAGGILIANIVYVAIYDAADQEALLMDVLRGEIARLDQAILAAPSAPPIISEAVQPHFAEHPDAYGYLILDSAGNRVDGMNAGLIPQALAESPVALGDWVAREASQETVEAFASHVVMRPEGAYRVYFAILEDPVNLMGTEVWDEYLGHVWRPLIPTLVLLIGGSLLILRRDLAPVAEAAAWARKIQPERPLDPFKNDDMPTEIEDLTDAVNRAVGRLNTELEDEKRRAAEAAHALRTPVAVLVARLDSLPDDKALNPLRDDIKALSRTVTQFLLSSGADRIEVSENTRIDLNETAEKTVVRLTPFAIMSGSEIVFRTNDESCPVLGVAEAVDLALTNLIEKAVCHGGGGPVEVTVGPGLVVSVSDTGTGLPDGADGVMFDPFWRGEDAPKGGAGLGLAIVARIQKAHGGRVEAVNGPDGGAVFRLHYAQFR
jgi:two-component system OmpR family sensor kinase